MIYQKFVEIGRVVYVAKGKDTGKLAVIVNVIDGNKVLSLIFKLKTIINFRLFWTDRYRVYAAECSISRICN